MLLALLLCIDCRARAEQQPEAYTDKPGSGPQAVCERRKGALYKCSLGLVPLTQEECLFQCNPTLLIAHRLMSDRVGEV